MSDFASHYDTYDPTAYMLVGHDEYDALIAAAELLRRMSAWDALNPPTVAPYGDAPFWRSEIDRVVAALE